MQNKLRLKQFAAQVEISDAYLSHIIAGHRRPSPRLAQRIEEATDGQVTRLELLYPKEN